MTLSSCCGFCHPVGTNENWILFLEVSETTDDNRTRHRTGEIHNIKGHLELDFIVMYVLDGAENPNF